MTAYYFGGGELPGTGLMVVIATSALAWGFGLFVYGLIQRFTNADRFTCKTCGRTLPTRTLRFNTPRFGEMRLVRRDECRRCWTQRIWPLTRRATAGRKLASR